MKDWEILKAQIEVFYEIGGLIAWTVGQLAHSCYK